MQSTLADHPTVQCGPQGDGYNVGMLGVLNGLCGVRDSNHYGSAEERNEFFTYAEAGMIDEASAVVDRVYERMFQERG